MGQATLQRQSGCAFGKSQAAMAHDDGSRETGTFKKEAMQNHPKKKASGVLTPHRPTSNSIDSIKTDVAGWSTPDLKAELAKLLGFSAENLTRLSIIVTELESRGEDLKSIHMGLLPILRQIASGELLPDIVVLYAGQPALLKGISKLHVDEQKRIASGEAKYEPPPSAAKRLSAGTSFKEPRRVNLMANDDIEDISLDDDVEAKTITGVSRNGLPRDVAEMAFDLIRNHADKEQVLGHLFVLLSKHEQIQNVMASLIATYQPMKGNNA